MNRTKQVYRRIIRVAAYVAIFQVISCVLLTTTAFAASRIQISTPVGREKFVSNTRQKQPKIYRRLSIKSNNLSKSLVQANGSPESEVGGAQLIKMNMKHKPQAYFIYVPIVNNTRPPHIVFLNERYSAIPFFKVTTIVFLGFFLLHSNTILCAL